MFEINKKKLIKEIDKICWINGKFTLRSGQISNKYFDKYCFESRPNLLVKIANLIVQKISIKNKYFFALAGLELGGIPIAVAVSLQNGIPVLFVRKKIKDYGTQQFAEGLNFKGKKLIIIEDVVTTGGQIIKSTKMLRESGAIIEEVICVLLRDEISIKNLFLEGLSIDYIFSYKDFESKKII